MPKVDDFGRPIDQTIVNLARAMRTVESGNNYTRKGASGEYGAYQWMPGNFETASKKYFGEVLPKTPVNQDKVAYYQMIDLKNKGYTPEQVASTWNSGSPEYKGKIGVNSKGVKYDVPAYVDKVMTEYLSQRDRGLSIDYPKSPGMQLTPVAHAAELGTGAPETKPLDEVEMKLGATGQPQGLQPADNMLSPIRDVAAGASKGVITTLLNTGGLVESGLDQTLGRLINAAKGRGFVPTDTGKKVLETAAQPGLQPQGTLENIGFYGEKAAEFIAPTPATRKIEAGIDALITGAGFLNAAKRVALKAGTEALAGGAVGLAQTGKADEAVSTGAVFGGIKGVTGAAGEFARAFRLPERIYSSIFKNTLPDVKAQLKSEALVKMQKTNPAKFQSLVKSGIITLEPGGIMKVNDTLAKEALDKGLKGNVRTMSDTVINGLYDSEAKVRAIAKTAKAKVNMTEKNFRVVLQNIAKDYGNVGFGEFAQKAKALDNAIKAGRGKVSVDTALEVRRLFDGLRTRSSYAATSPNLSLSQENLKDLSNALRGRINDIPGMGDVMKDYSFYIEALDHIAREAARRGNNQIVSLIDSVFFSGAAVGNPAIGSALGVGRRLLSTPYTATNIAQSIERGGLPTKTGSFLKGAFSTSLRPSPEGQ